MFSFFEENVVNRNSVTPPQPSHLMQKIITAATSVSDKGTVPQDQMLTYIDHTKIEIVDGSESVFDLIVREIKKAKKQILIQAFSWIPSTQIVQDIRKALSELKEEVEVFLLVDQLDRIARMFYLGEIPPHKSEHDPASLGLDNLPANIKLHIGTLTHNSMAANHNKAIWIDGKLIMTGANLQPENYGSDRFHDAGMFIPQGINAVYYDFISMWEQRTNKSENSDVTPTSLEFKPDLSITSCAVVHVANTLRAKPAVLPFYQASLPADPLNNAYLAAINNATNVIRIAVPNLNTPEIVQALAEFINKKNGCVQLVLTRGFNDIRETFYGGTNQNTVEQLIYLVDEDKRDNLQMYWYKNETSTNTPAVNHMKYMEVDNQIVIYGSANLDLISLHNCHETNIIIDSSEFAQRATNALFTPIFERGTKIKINERRSCFPCQCL